ncbi:testis-expressed protein 36 [Pempheris klunzingeri]|uniref:testis-expressed protein 36 n=1 Tax=Pempheris klunzingeri TaxID=3127111 RepID=UPI0039804A54
MVKGGKRYFSINNDGKWFAHPGSPENEKRNRETCTSTGIMLTQVKSSLPQALNSERYPKRKTQQESREYSFSDHDNKYALKDSISIFTRGVGRRKCSDDHRQHNSHFCLCHDGADGSAQETAGNITGHQTEFVAGNGRTSTRRFPRSHQQRSAEAALARAGEQFLWFGRHDSDHSESLQVLAATNCSGTSKP